MHSLTELEAIKQGFIAARGYWRPWTEAILQGNPAFLSHYAEYAGYPARTGPLSARMVELIYVALDASATHLFEAGVSTHMRIAREAGASDGDIYDVLHLVTLQGLSSVLRAADLLYEGADPLPEQDALAVYIDRLWPEQADSLKRLAAQDRGYVEAVLDFVAGGAVEHGLSTAERLLVKLALHAAFTHADMAATRKLIAVGLKAGLARTELLQAIQLGAHLAVHGAALGATVHAKLAPSPTGSETWTSSSM